MKCAATTIKKDSIKGRCVYALEKIRPGKVVEVCQLIIVHEDEVGDELSRFVFHYKGNFNAIALGNGSLYNHSSSPNMTCYFDFKKQLIVFESLRTIGKGEELVFNYGYTNEEKKRFNIP
jgi:SET domain-containing protein